MKNAVLVLGLVVGCGGSSAAPADSTSHPGALTDASNAGPGEASDEASGDLTPSDASTVSTGTDGGTNDLDGATALDGATDGADAAPNDGRGVFVAVGYGGRRMRSIDDGATWIDDQSLEPDGGGDDNDLLRTVAYGGGLFLAAGWQTLSSPDGKTWTPLPATHQNWFGALVFADPGWVAVGGYGMRLTSPDGTTWADHSVDTIAAHAHGCLTVTDSPSAFVACNDNGARSYSADGKTWVYATGATDAVSSQVVAGAGVVVGVDGANVVVSKDAGKTWTHATTLASAGGGLVFAQGHFTYLSTDAVFTSTDGSAWTKHASTGARPSALAFGHGTYVAIRGHAWQRSTDGLTWSTSVQDASSINALEWVTFGPTP